MGSGRGVRQGKVHVGLMAMCERAEGRKSKRAVQEDFKMPWASLPEGGISHSGEFLWRLRSLEIHFWKVSPHLFSICHHLSALLWEQSHYTSLGSQRQQDPPSLARPRPWFHLDGKRVANANASQIQLSVSVAATDSPADCFKEQTGTKNSTWLNNYPPSLIEQNNINNKQLRGCSSSDVLNLLYSKQEKEKEILLIFNTICSPLAKEIESTQETYCKVVGSRKTPRT